MCEIFGLTALHPTTVRLSLDELARHGGATGPHEDGWGIAFYDDKDALLIREPERAAGSAWVEFLATHHVRSSTVVAHVRKATQGARRLRNTQPFSRELGGRMHVFSHNGRLDGIEADKRSAPRRFRPIGETDSEVAFMALLEVIGELWSASTPPTLDARLDVLERLAADLRTLGPANFVYSDGDALFAHGHRRSQSDGTNRPPGLHLLCRTCVHDHDPPSIAGVVLEASRPQEVALVASVPLTTEAWRPFEPGEIVALRDGREVARRVP